MGMEAMQMTFHRAREVQCCLIAGIKSGIIIHKKKYGFHSVGSISPLLIRTHISGHE